MGVLCPSFILSLLCCHCVQGPVQSIYGMTGRGCYLLIKTATSATFVVMIQGSSCLYAGPKYSTPPWKQGNDCIIATKRPAQAKPGRACCVCCFFFNCPGIHLPVRWILYNLQDDSGVFGRFATSLSALQHLGKCTVRSGSPPSREPQKALKRREPQRHNVFSGLV